jgi:hypothetical protein
MQTRCSIRCECLLFHSQWRRVTALPSAYLLELNKNLVFVNFLWINQSTSHSRYRPLAYLNVIVITFVISPIVSMRVKEEATIALLVLVLRDWEIWV